MFHFSISSEFRVVTATDLPASRRRNAESDLSLVADQTAIFPVSVEDAFEICNGPGSIGFSVAKFALVARALQRQYTSAVRLAILEFSIIAPRGPVLRAATGLPALVPLALVLLVRLVVVRPLQTSGALSQPVDAIARPVHGFVELRMRIPDFAAALGISNEVAGLDRLRSAAESSAIALMRTKPLPTLLSASRNLFRSDVGSVRKQGQHHVSQQLLANIDEFVTDHSVRDRRHKSAENPRADRTHCPLSGSGSQSGRPTIAHLAHFRKILRSVGADTDQLQPSPVIAPVKRSRIGISFLQGAHQVAQ